MLYIMTSLSSSGRGVPLEASVGSTAPAKERRVLNDPKGLFGADFDQIPVTVLLKLKSIPHFLFCGRCNTGPAA